MSIASSELKVVFFIRLSEAGEKGIYEQRAPDPNKNKIVYNCILSITIME